MSHFPDYRQTLDCFATGVAVVTMARPDGCYAGLTVHSFSSASLDPPLILWSVDLWGGAYPAFRESRHFAVNILAEEQQHLSQRFSGPEYDRFDGVPLDVGLGGAPLIRACVATLECTKHDAHLAGDHAIIVAQVRRFSCNVNRDPLVLCQGTYARLQPTAAAPPTALLARTASASA